MAGCDLIQWISACEKGGHVEACEKGGQVEETSRMFAELRQWHKPDVISYNASISACENGTKWGFAVQYLQEMRDWGHASLILEEMKEGHTWPDTTAYMREGLSDLSVGGSVEDVFGVAAAAPARRDQLQRHHLACGAGGEWGLTSGTSPT